jgi:hypothetical protein
MDQSKPPIPLSEFRLRSASRRACADIDTAPPELMNSGELGAAERQSRSGQVEVRQNDPPDGPSVAVYYRNEAEVREGFLTALRAMRVAVDEQHPEPAKPPISCAKPASMRASLDSNDQEN